MKDNKNIKVCLVGSSGGHLTHLYMLSCPTNEHYKYLENLIHYLVNK